MPVTQGSPGCFSSPGPCLCKTDDLIAQQIALGHRKARHRKMNKVPISWTNPECFSDKNRGKGYFGIIIIFICARIWSACVFNGLTSLFLFLCAVFRITVVGKDGERGIIIFQSSEPLRVLAGCCVSYCSLCRMNLPMGCAPSTSQCSFQKARVLKPFEMPFIQYYRVANENLLASRGFSK